MGDGTLILYLTKHALRTISTKVSYHFHNVEIPVIKDTILSDLKPYLDKFIFDKNKKII